MRIERVQVEPRFAGAVVTRPNRFEELRRRAQRRRLWRGVVKGKFGVFCAYFTSFLHNRYYLSKGRLERENRRFSSANIELSVGSHFSSRFGDRTCSSQIGKSRLFHPKPAANSSKSLACKSVNAACFTMR